MGIPSKVAENSFVTAEKLILVQFPDAGTANSARLATTTTATAAMTASGAASVSPKVDGQEALSFPTEEDGGVSSLVGVVQHPMGVVCSCVRTGWSLMSSLFCVGEEVGGWVMYVLYAMYALYALYVLYMLHALCVLYALHVVYMLYLLYALRVMYLPNTMYVSCRKCFFCCRVVPCALYARYDSGRKGRRTV